MEDKMNIWNQQSQPPKWALRPIAAGRLKGKTDINPQWRYQAMTEMFGACGTGWKYTIDRLWTEPAPDGQVFAFSQISLYYKTDEWSVPIVGVGGSMLVQQESRGLHANDEGFKMATTDAIGTAMKMIGIASDIYAGKWDGSKYQDTKEKQPPKDPKELLSKKGEQCEKLRQNAYTSYCNKYADKITDPKHKFDQSKLDDAMRKILGKMPTTKAEVSEALSQIKPEDIIIELPF